MGPDQAIAAGSPWRLGYRPALDGLRGVAVLLVVLAHAKFLRNAGAVGVDIFFVLSGFLITSLLLAENARTGRIDLIAFYRRRAARLFPALLLVCACIALYLVLIGQPDRLLPEVGGALSYVGNWLQAAGVRMGLAEHTWSLADEEQFYLIWPLAMIALIRFPKAGVVVLGILVISIVWRQAVPGLFGATGPRASRALDVVAPALIAGCALAFVLRSRPNLATGWAGLAVGSAIVTYAVTTLALGGVGSWTLELTTLGVVLIISSVHHSETGILTWKPLAYTGRISYGIYLWHFPVFSILVLPRLLEFAIVFVIAMLSYHLFEAPILRRYGRRQTKPVTDAQSTIEQREAGTAAEAIRS